MKRIAWTESAQRDLAALDSEDTQFTDRVGRAALSAARFLSDHPRAGPVLRSGTRKWTLRGTDFVLIYRPVGDGVQIIRLLSAYSDWRAAFD